MCWLVFVVVVCGLVSLLSFDICRLIFLVAVFVVGVFFIMCVVCCLLLLGGFVLFCLLLVVCCCVLFGVV